jgi:hypothetical protein
MDELRRQAEAEMRRPAPPLGDEPPSKKHKPGDETAVERFSYAAVESLMQGCTCILATCGFRR